MLDNSPRGENMSINPLLFVCATSGPIVEVRPSTLISREVLKVFREHLLLKEKSSLEDSDKLGDSKTMTCGKCEGTGRRKGTPIH